jgi:hypothetical protein
MPGFRDDSGTRPGAGPLVGCAGGGDPRRLAGDCGGIAIGAPELRERGWAEAT